VKWNRHFSATSEKLFDSSIRSFGLENWPEAIRTYERIGLTHEPLTLVTPAFQVPIPPFRPSVFPPRFREVAPPELELFDLDDAFSSPQVQLAQLTNRCTENELDIYIREAGNILGVNKLLAVASNSDSNQQVEVSSKKILSFIIRRLVQWKKETGGEDTDTPAATFIVGQESLQTHIVDENGEEEGAYFSDIEQYDDLAE